jgi:MFS transporter, OFA family, oxalate/formate antiporter
MKKKAKIFYGWWIVLVTNIICMTGFGTWLYAFPAFFGPMTAEFGWSRAQTSGAASFRSIEGGIAGPIVGWLVDKFGSRNVVLGSGIISGFGFVLMTQVNSLISFYLIYGLVVSVGMSGMTYIPAFTVIAKWFKKRLSLAFSLLAIGAALGGTFWSPAAAWLIANYGWRSAFFVIGIAIWAIVIPLSFVIVETPEKKGLRMDNDPEDDGKDADSDQPKPLVQPDYTARQALASRSFWLLSIAWFFQSMAFNVVFVHGVVAMTDMGIEYLKAAALIGAITSVSFFGRMILGLLGDYIEKRYLLFFAYCLISGGIFALANAHSMGMVYLFVGLYGFGYGGTVPVMASLRADYFGRTALGKIQGFMSPVAMLAGAFGPVVTGYIFDQTASYTYAFSVIGTLAFIGAWVLLFTKPKILPGTLLEQTADSGARL